MSTATLTALVDALDVSQAGIEDRVVAQAAARWARVTEWRDPEQVVAASVAVGRMAETGSASTARLTSAYMARVVYDMAGTSIDPAIVNTSAPLRAGALTWPAVYERVAQTIGYERSVGTPLDEAIRRGLTRSETMLRTDMALARRDQSRQSLASSRRVIGYRRVIRPEFSKGGVCGLCIAAADRWYQTDQLMPIHDRCRCSVMPITGDSDPGETLNDDVLAEAYVSAESNRAVDLKAVRVRVEQHSELGPRLVSDGPRSPGALARRNERESAPRSPATRRDTAARSRAYMDAARARADELPGPSGR